MAWHGVARRQWHLFRFRSSILSTLYKYIDNTNTISYIIQVVCMYVCNLILFCVRAQCTQCGHVLCPVFFTKGNFHCRKPSVPVLLLLIFSLYIRIYAFSTIHYLHEHFHIHVRRTYIIHVLLLQFSCVILILYIKKVNEKKMEYTQ